MYHNEIKVVMKAFLENLKSFHVLLNRPGDGSSYYNRPCSNYFTGTLSIRNIHHKTVLTLYCLWQRYVAYH